MSSKYHNHPVDGFDSISERNRWTELCLLERAGKITNLRRQVRFPLVVNGKRVCDYIADFVYVENGTEVVEDVKGFATAVFKLKSKLFTAVYGKEINIINSGTHFRAGRV